MYFYRQVGEVSFSLYITLVLDNIYILSDPLLLPFQSPQNNVNSFCLDKCIFIFIYKLNFGRLDTYVDFTEI